MQEGWTEDEKDAYVTASYYWDVSWALWFIGVKEFLKAGCSGDSSLSVCVELLMTVRMVIWRNINTAHVCDHPLHYVTLQTWCLDLITGQRVITSCRAVNALRIRSL